MSWFQRRHQQLDQERGTEQNQLKHESPWACRRNLDWASPASPTHITGSIVVSSWDANAIPLRVESRRAAWHASYTPCVQALSPPHASYATKRPGTARQINGIVISRNIASWSGLKPISISVNPFDGFQSWVNYVRNSSKSPDHALCGALLVKFNAK